MVTWDFLVRTVIIRRFQIISNIREDFILKSYLSHVGDEQPSSIPCCHQHHFQFWNLNRTIKTTNIPISSSNVVFQVVNLKVGVWEVVKLIGMINMEKEVRHSLVKSVEKPTLIWKNIWNTIWSQTKWPVTFVENHFHQKPDSIFITSKLMTKLILAHSADSCSIECKMWSIIKESFAHSLKSTRTELKEPGSNRKYLVINWKYQVFQLMVEIYIFTPRPYIIGKSHSEIFKDRILYSVK